MTVDYHNFTTKDTPKSERDLLFVGDIWINAAECGVCGEVIRSKNKHDYVGCSCGNIAVDGGSHYAKRSFTNAGPFTNIIEMYSDVEGR